LAHQHIAIRRLQHEPWTIHLALSPELDFESWQRVKLRIGRKSRNGGIVVHMWRGERLGGLGGRDLVVSEDIVVSALLCEGRCKSKEHNQQFLHARFSFDWEMPKNSRRVTCTHFTEQNRNSFAKIISFAHAAGALARSFAKKTGRPQ